MWRIDGGFGIVFFVQVKILCVHITAVQTFQMELQNLIEKSNQIGHDNI